MPLTNQAAAARWCRQQPEHRTSSCEEDESCACAAIVRLLSTITQQVPHRADRDSLPSSVCLLAGRARRRATPAESRASARSSPSRRPGSAGPSRRRRWRRGLSPNGPASRHVDRDRGEPIASEPGHQAGRTVGVGDVLWHPNRGREHPVRPRCISLRPPATDLLTAQKLRRLHGG